jgi:hypothetical protein
MCPTRRIVLRWRSWSALNTRIFDPTLMNGRHRLVRCGVRNSGAGAWAKGQVTDPTIGMKVVVLD